MAVERIDPARLIGVSHGHGTDESANPLPSIYSKDAARVMSAAMSANPAMSMMAAIQWLHTWQLIAFDNLTPAALIIAGRADDLIVYIRSAA